MMATKLGLHDYGLESTPQTQIPIFVLTMLLSVNMKQLTKFQVNMLNVFFLRARVDNKLEESHNWLHVL